MTRTLQSILAVLILAAAAIWFFTTMKTCNKSESADALTEDESEIADDLPRNEEVGTLDDLYEDDDTKNSTTRDEIEYDAVVKDAEYTESPDGKLASERESEGPGASLARKALEEDVEARPVATSPARSAGLPYLVVAGAYMSEQNAKTERNRLRDKGFSDAEVVVFDLSQYYTVITGRYASEQTATEAKQQLSKYGGTGYVHLKRSKNRN